MTNPTRYLYRRLTAGHYRVVGQDYFAHIHKEKGKWYVTIRRSHSGSLQQYGGIWKTLKDAVEESNSLLDQLE